MDKLIISQNSIINRNTNSSYQNSLFARVISQL